MLNDADVGENGRDEDPDSFLLNEGFDLLAAYRSIKSHDARQAILKMIAAVAEAERQAKEQG